MDFALGGVAGSLIAISKGQQTRLVGGLANSVALMGLVAHPDIKSKEDLKGKVVGVTSPNSVTDVLVRYLSRKLTGDAENGIRRAFLGGFQSQVAALKTGQTVAFTWTLEGIYDAEKQGVGKFLLSFGDEIPDFAFEAVIATRKMIDERPEVVRAFLEGVYEAVVAHEGQQGLHGGDLRAEDGHAEGHRRPRVGLRRPQAGRRRAVQRQGAPDRRPGDRRDRGVRGDPAALGLGGQALPAGEL